MGKEQLNALYDKPYETLAEVLTLFIYWQKGHLKHKEFDKKMQETLKIETVIDNVNLEDK